MQTIRLPYRAYGVNGSAVEILAVYADALSQNGAYIPDGINRASHYPRYELDTLFARLGWHLVSDVDGVLTYAGPLRDVPPAQ